MRTRTLLATVDRCCVGKSAGTEAYGSLKSEETARVRVLSKQSLLRSYPSLGSQKRDQGASYDLRVIGTKLALAAIARNGERVVIARTACVTCRRCDVQALSTALSDLFAFAKMSEGSRHKFGPLERLMVDGEQLRSAPSRALMRTFCSTIVRAACYTL